MKDYFDELSVEEYETLAPEDKTKFDYQIIKSLFYDEVCGHAHGAIDVMEKTDIVNDYKSKQANRPKHLGWLKALASCYQLAQGTQTRHELQASAEDTQFAVSLANELDDLASSLLATVNRIVDLEAAYMGVLHGRKEGVNILSDAGDHVPYDRQGELDKINAQKLIQKTLGHLEQEVSAEK